MGNTLNQLGELKEPTKVILHNLETIAKNIKVMSEQIKLYPSQLLFSGAPPRINPGDL